MSRGAYDPRHEMRGYANIDIIYLDVYGNQLELFEYDRPWLTTVASQSVIGQPGNFLI